MIRKAELIEHKILTSISFQSKSHWNYPAHYYDIWRDELTITPEYIDNNTVFVYEQQNRLWAYYSLTELEENIKVRGIELTAGLWLEHMFVLPDLLGRGVGSALFTHCAGVLTRRKHKRIHILADPNAVGFYLKMGCVFEKDYPSTIEGRTTPYLTFSTGE